VNDGSVIRGNRKCGIEAQALLERRGAVKYQYNRALK
jgi:hypothetical protein